MGSYQERWEVIQEILAGSDTITFSFEKIILAEYKEWLSVEKSKVLNDSGNCLERQKKKGGWWVVGWFVPADISIEKILVAKWHLPWWIYHQVLQNQKQILTMEILCRINELSKPKSKEVIIVPISQMKRLKAWQSR